MATTLSDDHQLLIDAVRDYARAELISRDAEWDRTESSCCADLTQLYEMGLMALRVPESDGGLACPMLPYAHIIRELAYASPAVAVTVAVHSMVCEVIRMFADESVRDKILSSLAMGGHLSAFAISEANSGSDPAAARTRAEKVDGGWRLNGTKMWVTNGIAGRWFIVLARTSRREDERDLSMLLMDAEQDGVTRRAIHGKMGIRGSETAELSLEDVFVPDEHMLGRPGQGLNVALSALDGGRIGIAAQAVGIAEACLDAMVSYSREREQFKRPISKFEAIQWMIADSQTEIAAATLLFERAAELKESGQPFTSESAMAKLYASEMANRVAYRAVQVHGGYGFVNEFRVEQLYRDARVTTIYEGTSEIQRYVIAREVLRKFDEA
ncbi:MAG: acyl-CoA dehydrogenase family protein [Phycisphaerae bacterium]|nr:acyl-CoA dehydrogenase family protein [Phycisphaerae bacterium]